jgi:dipeptidyl aminopeptidase/acylaminoacyl peptidase
VAKKTTGSHEWRVGLSWRSGVGEALYRVGEAVRPIPRHDAFVTDSPQPHSVPRWEARFRAANLTLPEWARDAPDRGVYTSNASGVWEIYTWDRASDTHRQVTDRPNGTTDATIDPAGEYVWWFADTDGDEFGVWRRQPFGGDHADAVDALPGLAAAYPAGLELGREVVVVGCSGEGGSTVHSVDPHGTATLLYAHAEDAGVGALSADETFVAIGHSEHGDSLHPDLRVIRRADGTTVAELSDGPGLGVHAVDFSPIPGDNRLLVVHERRGRPELMLWDPVADSVDALDIPLDGDLGGDWYPDGTALLVDSEHQARVTLHRLDLETRELSRVDTPPGTIDDAAARPDGTVEFRWSSASSPAQVRTAGAPAPMLVPPGPAAPPSVAVNDAWVDGPGGAVHVLWAAPPEHTGGPQATIFYIHGGPHWLDADVFMASRAAWLDAGYAVVHVNYRGSTGYGSRWRDAINGRPGLTELEDIAAVHDWAVAAEIADPARSVLAGRSWGGYLTLLGLGTQPERWAAGVAGVPVADYVAAYEDEMEPLQALDRVLFGGGPAEVPGAYAEASPITYAEKVRAPVLVTAGRNDPRCPIRQIDNYVSRLRELDHPVEEYRYDAGHGSMVVDEVVREMAAELEFVTRIVPPA